MFKKLLLSITLSLLGIASIGQTLILADSTPISHPVAAAIDRLNNIYIADNKGNLNQYSRGELVQSFSPQKQGDITLVEAWNPLKIFIYYADFQEFLLLDRFLTGSQRYEIPPPIRFSGLSTFSNDNNLWVIDDIDFGLKKYNLNFNAYTVNTPFDLILDQEKYNISFIREYQNLVFISDKSSGIFVFDNLGNYLRQITAPAVEHFSFYGENLHYLANRQLISINIYHHDRTALNLPEEALFAFRYEDHLALITESTLKIYRIQM